MLTVLLLASCLLRALGSYPYEEFRSNLEFLSDDTNLGEPAYRLLDIVQPRRFYIHLDTFVEEARFNGLATIEIDVLQANLNQIVFHQNVESISAVTVRDATNEILLLQISNPFELDNYYELIKINFENSIPTGTYTIEITYLGKINENPFDRGFYRGYHFTNGEKRYYATTQFQPFHARKAFPCFDEPQFKSVYVISITRPSSYSQSYSNMPIEATGPVIDGRVRETFYPTPIVSSYLVAFHVSEFVETTATGTSAKPFGIISRPGPVSQHPYAAQIGLDITNWMDDYFRINYYEMAPNMKNDHIALPDFPSGAMENWGMVNYREAYLLYDERNTNLINKIFIASIVAHEMAHKWFGNLVTCFWWSNLWLNESFASFFEYFGAHGADPSLELDSQFIVDYVHSALLYDAGPGSNPMNWSDVASNPSISAHFSTASYGKGASVLRMMEHFVGESTFQNALHYYLIENSYDVGTPEAMYDAFRKAVAEDNSLDNIGVSNIDVGQVMDTWIQNPGAPVLKVHVNMNTGVMTLTQSRYIISGTPPISLWHIPLTYTRGRAPNFQNTKPTHLMRTMVDVIQKEPGEEWVIFNVAQSGYYRVDYDEHNWNLIAKALREQRNTINRFNRAQIANDVLVFVRGEDIDIDLAFNILSFLQGETDYYVWAGALGQIEWLRRRLEHIPDLRKQFELYTLELMEEVIKDLTYTEGSSDSTSRILNRMQILNYACNIGHEGCIDDSLRLWRNFKNSNTPVPVNYRRYVYCMGLRHGDRADYDFLFGKYVESDNTADMVVMLRALACTMDQQALLSYLHESMTNDLIRYHDRTNAFSFALQGNPENIKTVLAFLQNKYKYIRINYGGSARLVFAVNTLPGFLTDFEDIVTFQAWLYSNQVQLQDVFQTGRNVITTAISNMQFANRIAVDLHNYIRTWNSAGSAVVSITLLFATIALNLIR